MIEKMSVTINLRLLMMSMIPMNLPATSRRRARVRVNST